MPCRDPYGYALTTSPRGRRGVQPRAAATVLRLRVGRASTRVAALDRARPDLRARATPPSRCSATSSAPQVDIAARLARRRAARRAAAPSASAATCTRSSRTSAATPVPWSRTSRPTRATRCCSRPRCRRSRSPASPRSPRRRGRSSSARPRRTATTGGSPGCWRSSARSRAASTRRWTCPAASLAERAGRRPLGPRPGARALRDRRPRRRAGLDGRAGSTGDGAVDRQPQPLLLARRAARAVAGRPRRRPRAATTPSCGPSTAWAAGPWWTPARCCSAGR